MDGRGLRTWQAAGALALGLFLGGCAALQPRVESLTVYALTAEPPRGAARTPSDLVIEIALPRAWPGFDTAQMVYVDRPYELDYFAASRWTDTPPRMLEPLLAQALEQTGSFRTVIQAPSIVPADVRLDTEVVRLQQDFATRPSRVEITLHVQLTDLRARRVVASRVLGEAERAPSEDAAGGVAAANTALQRMLAQIAEFCVSESGRLRR
jgi:cholesterol transport system auxiliary component